VVGSLVQRLCDRLLMHGLYVFVRGS